MIPIAWCVQMRLEEQQQALLKLTESRKQVSAQANNDAAIVEEVEEVTAAFEQEQQVQLFLQTP